MRLGSNTSNYNGLIRGVPVAPNLGRTVGRINARGRILEAASEVAHDVGPAHLSLDAVAERAGVSKGGLLYHFPTKQALIMAIVERHLATVEAAAGISETEPVPDGNAVALRLIRSFCDKLENKPGGAQGFLAAMAETPSLLDPIRAHNHRVVSHLRRARSRDAALLAFLVVEGMRTLELFDANPLSRVECEALLGRLETVLEQPPA
jgi:AcrR family transcriptional regulator